MTEFLAPRTFMDKHPAFCCLDHLLSAEPYVRKCPDGMTGLEVIAIMPNNHRVKLKQSILIRKKGEDVKKIETASIVGWQMILMGQHPKGFITHSFNTWQRKNRIEFYPVYRRRKNDNNI